MEEPLAIYFFLFFHFITFSLEILLLVVRCFFLSWCLQLYLMVVIAFNSKNNVFPV